MRPSRDERRQAREAKRELRDMATMPNVRVFESNVAAGKTWRSEQRPQQPYNGGTWPPRSKRA